MGVGHLVGEREDEAPIALDLFRCRLAPEHLDGVSQVLQPLRLELFDGVKARVVTLGFGRDDLVEQLALAVLLARLDVGPGDRERLANRPLPAGR